MKKNFLIAKIIFIIFIFIHEVCAATSNHDMADIVKVGTLRVGILKSDLPSFHVLRDGKLIGPEIDLANQIAQRLGVSVVIDNSADSYEKLIEMVVENKVDIALSKLNQSYSRVKLVRFSNPYISFRHALYFNRSKIAKLAESKPPDEILKNFKGTIGVMRKSVWVENAKLNFPNATVLEFDGWNNVIKALFINQVDAIYRDEFEIKRIMKLQPASIINYGSASIADRNALLSVAICESCSRLQEFINYHISQTPGNFSMKKLLEMN